MTPGSSYRPGREIARGGMGAVLDARDNKLGRSVAMKVMLRRNASEEEQQRFLQEARVLGQLAHPNIVPVHDVGTDEQGRLFYTMKLVQGVTLHEVIGKLKAGDKDTLAKYPLNALLTIFQKVCDAVAFAHSRGVIHRDLKPQNIMVGEFGEVLVMDWGLAKILPGSAASEEASKTLPLRGQLGQTGPTGTLPLNSPAEEQATLVSGEDQATVASGTGSASAPKLAFGSQQPEPAAPSGTYATLEGAVMGTPHFMSPEQAEGKIAELDGRSDIFSLGGILYALLTLRPPVEGDSLEEILSKVRSGTIAPPTAFNIPSSTTQAKASASGAVTEPRKIHPLPHCPDGKVPAALSAVTMKALTRDKLRRYQTVAEFTRDIVAYQGGFATSAENADALTLLRLFIHRHKALTTAASLIVLLTIGFLFKVNAEKQAALAAEARANQKADEAAQASEAAKAAEAVATRERETARQALAKSQLDLAEKEFERGKFVDGTPESFRDANWRFLRAHSHDYAAILSISRHAPGPVQFLPQGDRFVIQCGDPWGADVGIFTLEGKQLGGWIPVNKGYLGVFGIDSAGGRMAFAASTNEVAVRETSTGNVVRRWTCANGDIRDVFISPDGETVLVTSKQKLVAYATQTGAALWTQPFTGVFPAFTSDSRTVAILASKKGLDLKIQLLDTITGAVRNTLEASADNPSKAILQFSPTGDRLACLGGDEVILWNPKTAAKIRALHFPGEAVRLMSPSGDAVATTSGSRIRLWDTKSGQLLRSLCGASLGILHLAFSPDGKMLLTSHASGSRSDVGVWPTRLGEEITSVRPVGSASRVLFDRDGSRFYAFCRSAGAWETRSGLERWKYSKANASVQDLAIHPTDGSIILSEFGLGTFTHASSSGTALEAFSTRWQSSVKFNRTGQLLLTLDGAFSQVNPGAQFNVVEYPSGNFLQQIPLKNPRQPFAAFCLDDTAVATAALAGGITVWDWKAGTPLRQIAAAQTGSIACLTSNADGRHLASGGPDRWIRVWEAATGRLEAAFRAHWEGVRCVKFSPDGREILSGSEDGTVRINDAATGDERLAFYGLANPVADVDISADGKLIIAITTDGFTKVWERHRSSAAALLPQ